MKSKMIFMFLMMFILVVGCSNNSEKSHSTDIKEKQWIQYFQLNEKIEWGMTLPEVQEIMSKTEFKEFNVGPNDSVRAANWKLNPDNDHAHYLYYEGEFKNKNAVLWFDFFGDYYLVNVRIIFEDDENEWVFDDEAKNTFLNETINYFGECDLETQEKCEYILNDETIYIHEVSDGIMVEAQGKYEDKKAKRNEEKLENENLNHTSKNLYSVSEVNALADQEIPKLQQKYNIQESQASYTVGDYPTSIVTKVNLLHDDFPEILVVSQEYDYSRVRVFRFDQTLGRWEELLIPELQPHQNYSETEPLMYIGKTQFPGEEKERAVLGYWSGSGGYFGFQIIGNDRLRNFKVLLDKMDGHYPAGNILINNENAKIDISSNGKVVETYTQEDFER